jgi:hypothetical protein
LSYNLISATIPALKGFMRDFTTGGLGYSKDLTGGGHRNGSSTSYNMLSLSKSRTEAGLLPEEYPASVARVSSGPKLGSADSKGLKNATVGVKNQESESIASMGSRRILIRKGWEITAVE